MMIRLPVPANLTTRPRPDRAAPTDLADAARAARIRARVAMRAALIGIAGPAPLILRTQTPPATHGTRR